MTGPLTRAAGADVERSGGRRTFVIVCHAWYGDVIGGSFRLASEFAADLAERGRRVHYVCCAPREITAPTDGATERGVAIHRYPPPPEDMFRPNRARWHVRETSRLVRMIAAEHPVDVLSGHSPLQFLGAARVLRDSPTRSVYVVHSPFDDELLSNVPDGRVGWGRRLAAWAARRVDRQCLALADQVQTDSRYTLEVLRIKHAATLGQKGYVAPGWVDVARFQPADDRRRLRARLGGEWDTDLPVLFTLRRLEARMGLETFIDAAARVVRGGRSLRVLIGGSGSLHSELERRIEASGGGDSIRLVGRIAEEELPDCYAAADCFVLPTRALECFGLIVLEAFAAGTPVIATDVAAIPELAARQGPEWLFPAGDVNALVERIEGFLSGRLAPTVDVRRIAETCDRARVVDLWEQNHLAGAPSDAVRASLAVAPAGES